MNRSGRPLRFLALTVGGWAAFRVVMLWPPAADIVRAIPHFVQPTAAAAPMVAAPMAEPVATIWQMPAPRARAVTKPAPLARSANGPTATALALVGMIRLGDAQTVEQPSTVMIPPFAPPASLAARPSRWSGSAWLVARGGGAGRGAGFGGGQLGGSQAGLRIAYSLKRKLAAVARLTTPLEGKGRELAIGIDWQPTRLPLRLIAEQRIVLDGGKGGPAVGVVGGIGPAAIGGGFDLEAYGQAGAIDRHSVEGFADGAARVTRRVATIGRARIDVGGGAWGGAQRGAARLDIGPSAVLALPVGRVPARLILDWRQRIAGDARPGSGPALTLATDF